MFVVCTPVFQVIDDLSETGHPGEMEPEALILFVHFSNLTHSNRMCLSFSIESIRLIDVATGHLGEIDRKIPFVDGSVYFLMESVY